jgi:hypothetical protein
MGVVGSPSPSHGYEKRHCGDGVVSFFISISGSQHHAQSHESDLEEDYMEVSFILHRFIDTFINGELLSPFHRTTVTIYH